MHRRLTTHDNRSPVPSLAMLWEAGTAPPPTRPRGRGARLTIEEWESLPPALRRATGAAHHHRDGEGWA